MMIKTKIQVACRCVCVFAWLQVKVAFALCGDVVVRKNKAKKQNKT